MGNRGLTVAGLIAVFVIVPSAIYLNESSPVLAAGIVLAVGIIWWAAKLDWWQRAFALTLTMGIGATSSIEPLAAVAEYGRFAAVALLLIATMATGRGVESGRYSKLPRRLIGTLIVILILAAASVAWSVVPVESALHVAALGMLIVIIRKLISHRWTNRETMVADFRAGYWILVASFVACLAAAAAGHGEAYNLIGGSRLQGIFSNPNTMGQLAAVIVPLGWGLAREKRSRGITFGLIPSVAVLLLSESRTAVVAAAVAVLWMILRSSLKTLLTILYAGVIALIGVMATGWNLFGDTLERFGSTAGGDRLSGRLDIWGGTIDLIAERPFGHGWQSAPSVLTELSEAGILREDFSSVHSSYLQFLFDLGLVGLLPLIVLVAYLLALAIRGNMSGIGTGLVGVIVAGMVVQLAESAMFGTGQAYPYIFWFAVAGSLTMYEPKTHKQQRKELKRTRPRQTALR